MLVARRDAFHPDAHEHSFEAPRPRIARTVSMLQIGGSLLAIPVGLASAYSIYHANFSVETTCQSLRANIIAIIDKRIDVGARRILVHHDVEKFEQTCGAVDPDATLAFKNLLAADTASAGAAQPKGVTVARPQPAEPERKVAPRAADVREPPLQQSPPVKHPVAAPAALPVRRAGGVNDVQWVDAVRHALIVHDETANAAQRSAPRPAQDASPARSWTPAAARALGPAAQPAPMAPVVQPPAAAVAAPPRVDHSHPVPPAAIPDAATVEAAPNGEPQSRIGRLIARVPLLGPIWKNGQQ
jgi:hypothetical protein